MRFRGCLRPFLSIMGLLAGDYTCHLTLLSSFCPGTVALSGGLRPPLFIMGLLVGNYICHLTLLLSLCALPGRGREEGSPGQFPKKINKISKSCSFLFLFVLIWPRNSGNVVPIRGVGGGWVKVGLCVARGGG